MQRRGTKVRQTWRHRYIAYGTLVLLMLGLVLLIGGCAPLTELIIQASGITPTPAISPTPTPGPAIRLSPTEGGPETRITVTGEGWRPADTIFVRLVDPESGEGPQTAYAAALVADTGTFTTSFVFPADERWMKLPRVRVLAWSPATGQEATADFHVIPVTTTPTPTPTFTLTPTATPTATPTRPAPTATPTWTPTPHPTATPTPTVVGWHGEYYNNRSLVGAPALVRTDKAIDFDWGYSAPAPGLPANYFSVRWTRTMYFPEGVYEFYALSDDGVRVWVDGELIIDQWHDATGVTYTAEWTLNAGTHALRVEYYDDLGAARIRFWWKQVGNFPQWRGEYFDNINLTGTPRLVRNDAKIDFNWGQGAPASGLPVNSFSVRWTRTISFDAGLYRFHVIVDDGARLYVDGDLLIDAWHDGSAREITAERELSAGPHDLRVEYYEHIADARIRVWWEKLTEHPRWHGTYWANRHLTGAPRLTRDETTIDFDWGTGSPGETVPSDNFSA
ncbi:MAG: hypothetical protein J7M34_01985, partial [Anaerolineae bacterium]|nr:hypothetical protein [Anaerolineae bacterium]